MPNWSPKPPKWSKEEYKLLPRTQRDSAKTDVSTVLLQTLLEKSDAFPRKFPIDTNRCKTLKSHISQDVLERNINSAYPILHENVLHLYSKFILHKRQHGNAKEKPIYQQIDLIEFIDRLLTKRAGTFISTRDYYSLLNGVKGSQAWETIGTLYEKEPLLLKNCISYEEIKLSAFLSVSSLTYFINIGDRKNFGVLKRDLVQDEGVIMGVIGPRLVKKGVMDYQDMVIHKSQNTKDNGYGLVSTPTIHHLFAEFYEDECLEYEEIVQNVPQKAERYTQLNKGEILDNHIYYKRLVFTIDTLFMEANFRAKEYGTMAYVHVVGIGLGLWKISSCQNKLFMDTCAQRIRLLRKNLHHISDICFAYIGHTTCGPYKHGDTIPIEEHPSQGIKIHIYKREPHEKLTGGDAGAAQQFKKKTFNFLSFR